ncbi:MAG: hypothetical protein ACYDG2_22245 [Ruminiclostridium sp.]
MPRISNEQIDNLTGRQRKAYVDQHPSEGLRFIQTSASEAKYYAGRYADYQKNKIVEAFFGNSLTLLEPPKN